MSTRKSKKLGLMKETLRQLTPDQLGQIQGGGGDANTRRCEQTWDCDDALGVRTRRCAC